MINFLTVLELIRDIFSVIGTLFAVYQALIHFYPEKTHLFENKLFKHLKRITNRNALISFKFFKSYTVISDVTKKAFYNDLENFFSNETNILINNSSDEIKIHFNKNEVSFDYIIFFEMEDTGEFIDSILINQNSEIKLKDVKTFLENSFWILKDILNLQFIGNTSKKIEVVISSEKFTFFDNTFNILGNNILGNEWNISKEGDLTQISSNVLLNLDSINKIMELILLNIKTT